MLCVSTLFAIVRNVCDSDGEGGGGELVLQWALLETGWFIVSSAVPQKKLLLSCSLWCSAVNFCRAVLVWHSHCLFFRTGCSFVTPLHTHRLLPQLCVSAFDNVVDSIPLLLNDALQSPALLNAQRERRNEGADGRASWA